MTPDLEPREATGGVALTEEHSGDPDFMAFGLKGDTGITILEEATA